ncbi:MAG: hypothetical protein KAS38_17705, partial [Anaerolineales bacterium]|nr:hypothetical protein [Anaerolineales bacterium]
MAQKMERLISRYWWLALIVGALVVICALAVIIFAVIIPLGERYVSSGSTNPALSDSSSDVQESDSTSGDGEPGLQVGLDEGQAQPLPVTPVPQVSGEPLSQQEVEQILLRLPALLIDSEDQLDFKLPEESLPPPRTGETIEETFPPPEAPIKPAPVEVGPLEVLRFAPEGEIPLAPFISITFNQPMVPLGTLEDLAAEQVPVLIEPSLPGTWRWIGTKTLTFQHDSTKIDRLPMATEYVVTVPAGTESATGGILAEMVQWSFSTPPPKMISSYPYDVPQPLDPVFFVGFDQRINPQAVLETIQVVAGDRPVQVKLVSEEEVKGDETVDRLAKSAGQGRWLAFQAVEPLPADTSISVAVGPGTPSAEGPLVTQDTQSYFFHTYAPLRIDDHGCTWSYDQCRPLSPFFIRFNNPINVEAYEDSMLSIEPELPGASVDIYGNTINIKGATEGQKTYRVTVDGSIQDVFGQTLGKDTSLTFRVGPAEPLLLGPEQILVTLDPASSEPVFSVYAINYNKLDVQIYAVEPSDWLAFKEYLREYQRTDNPPKPPGRLVLDETMRLETPSDTLTEVGIELSEVMEGDF